MYLQVMYVYELVWYTFVAIRSVTWRRSELENPSFVLCLFVVDCENCSIFKVIPHKVQYGSTSYHCRLYHSGYGWSFSVRRASRSIISVFVSPLHCMGKVYCQKTFFLVLKVFEIHFWFLFLFHVTAWIFPSFLISDEWLFGPWTYCTVHAALYFDQVWKSLSSLMLK